VQLLCHRQKVAQVSNFHVRIPHHSGLTTFALRHAI